MRADGHQHSRLCFTAILSTRIDCPPVNIELGIILGVSWKSIVKSILTAGMAFPGDNIYWRLTQHNNASRLCFRGRASFIEYATRTVKDRQTIFRYSGSHRQWSWQYVSSSSLREDVFRRLIFRPTCPRTSFWNLLEAPSSPHCLSRQMSLSQKVGLGYRQSRPMETE